MNYIDAINEMTTGTILIVNNTKYRLTHEMIQAKLNTGWVNTDLTHLKLTKLNFEFLPTSLSDKQFFNTGNPVYNECDVIKFIQDIKYFICKHPNDPTLINKINELAGKQLIINEIKDSD